MSFKILPEPEKGISETTKAEAKEHFDSLVEDYTEHSKSIGSVPVTLRVAPNDTLKNIVSKQLVRKVVREMGISILTTRSGPEGFIVKPNTVIQKQIQKAIGKPSKD